MTQHTFGTPKPETPMAAMFNRVARDAGKTTIAQMDIGGGWLVWVTPNEVDPMKALLSAALTIMAQRGTNVDTSKGVSIKKMLVQTRGMDYYWQVTDADGKQIAEGYAATEAEAAQEVAQYVKLPAAAAPCVHPACGETCERPCAQHTMNDHVLYSDADKDRPEVICDSNGQVTLSLCKRCGKAEAELDGPCRPVTQQDN